MARTKTKRLTHNNQYTFFMQNLEPGQICTYDPAWFLFKDIRKLAQEQHIAIEYIGANKYKQLRNIVGCFGFIIIDTPNYKEEAKKENSINIKFDIEQIFWRHNA
jgi:hypothetical protein